MRPPFSITYTSACMSLPPVSGTQAVHYCAEYYNSRSNGSINDQVHETAEILEGKKTIYCKQQIVRIAVHLGHQTNDWDAFQSLPTFVDDPSTYCSSMSSSLSDMYARILFRIAGNNSFNEHHPNKWHIYTYKYQAVQTQILPTQLPSKVSTGVNTQQRPKLAGTRCLHFETSSYQSENSHCFHAVALM